MKKHRRAREGKVPPALIGALTACAVCLALLALAAFLTQRGSLPESAMQAATGFSCALASLAGSLPVARWKGGGPKHALLAGSVFLALLLLGSLLFSGREGPGGFFITALVCAAAPALLGAFAGRGAQGARFSRGKKIARRR